VTGQVDVTQDIGTQNLTAAGSAMNGIYGGCKWHSWRDTNNPDLRTNLSATNNTPYARNNIVQATCAEVMFLRSCQGDRLQQLQCLTRRVHTVAVVERDVDTDRPGRSLSAVRAASLQSTSHTRCWFRYRTEGLVPVRQVPITAGSMDSERESDEGDVKRDDVVRVWRSPGIIESTSRPFGS
jgi:hypothetical protein